MHVDTSHMGPLSATSPVEVMTNRIDEASSLLKSLDAATSAEAAASALSQLAAKVDLLEPSEISSLSESARESGALQKICLMLGDHSAHVNALSILANLTTVEVNPRAGDAKAMLKASNSIALVVRHLFSEYVQTAALACAVCQNVVVNDAEVVTTLHRSGGVGRLRELASCDVATIASAASGCLANLTNLWLRASECAVTAPRSWHKAATQLQVGPRRLNEGSRQPTYPPAHYSLEARPSPRHARTCVRTASTIFSPPRSTLHGAPAATPPPMPPSCDAPANAPILLRAPHHQRAQSKLT